MEADQPLYVLYRRDQPWFLIYKPYKNWHCWHCIQVYANVEAGVIPCTRRTEPILASLALSWSMGTNTKPTQHINLVNWLRRTQLCVLSWCAKTSRSMEVCWLAMVSSKGFLQAIANSVTVDERRREWVGAVDILRTPRAQVPQHPTKNKWSASLTFETGIWKCRT
jgi:hypothetical protein